MTKDINRYAQLISAIFFRKFREGDTEVAFEREDIIQAADELRIKLPKNN